MTTTWTPNTQLEKPTLTRALMAALDAAISSIERGPAAIIPAPLPAAPCPDCKAAISMRDSAMEAHDDMENQLAGANATADSLRADNDHLRTQLVTAERTLRAAKRKAKR